MTLPFAARLLAFGTLALAACDESTTAPPTEEPGTDCLTEPPVDLDPLVAATERYCSTEGCASDYSFEDCRFYVPFDIASYALASQDQGGCLDAQVAHLDCLAASSGCSPADCAEAAEAAETACQLAVSPAVPEPFPGAVELCTHETACWLDRDDPEFEPNVAHCLATQMADLWIRHHQSERECTCELAAFRRCTGQADLSCSATRADLDAACPMQSGDYNLCVSDTICVALGGGGTPTSCTEEVSCGGTIYEVRCEDGSCSCTVGGEAGPAVTATDCTDDAFRECGAPL